MTDVRYMVVSAEDEGQRLDNFLFRILKGVPKSYIYRLIRGGEVRVNSKRAAVGLKLIQGDRVRIPPVRCSPTKSFVVGSRTSQLLLERIIYEDDKWLVINKPSGLAVHGGSGLSLGVIEALREIRSDIPYLELAHRLDKETSGCLVLAKKRSALRLLQAQLEQRLVKKTYTAILQAPWTGKNQITMDAALKKNILSSGERIVVVDPSGKPSLTVFKLIENFQTGCWVEAYPKTGRTHQIRVHSAALGCAILGDAKYGHASQGLPLKMRLYLHAKEIQFTINGQLLTFVAEVDDDFAAAIAQLRLRRVLGHE